MNHKQSQLKRIINPNTQKIVVVPLDHGMYKRPIAELACLDETLPKIAQSSMGAILLHKGLIKHYQKLLLQNNFPYFLHISASTGMGDPIHKVPIASVSEALDLNAVGVSMTIYLGNEYEPEMLKFLGKASMAADKLGLLLYVMMYIAKYRNGVLEEDTKADAVKYAARVGFEAGVDIIEIRYPDDPSRLREIKDICPVPLLVADSCKYSDEEYQRILDQCVKNNLDGVSISTRILDIRKTEKIINQTVDTLFKKDKLL